MLCAWRLARMQSGDLVACPTSIHHADKSSVRHTRYVCGHCLGDDMLLWLVSSDEHLRMYFVGVEQRCRFITCLAGQMGFHGSFGAALQVVESGKPDWRWITAIVAAQRDYLCC